MINSLSDERMKGTLISLFLSPLYYFPTRRDMQSEIITDP